MSATLSSVYRRKSVRLQSEYRHAARASYRPLHCSSDSPPTLQQPRLLLDVDAVIVCFRHLVDAVIVLIYIYIYISPPEVPNGLTPIPYVRVELFVRI